MADRIDRMTLTQRGGGNMERLYFRDDEFDDDEMGHVLVRHSDFPGCDMEDLKARHLARYHLVCLFCRPGFALLDLPCGSGYGADVVGRLGVKYEGFDGDDATVAYARRQYGADGVYFGLEDMRALTLPAKRYDVIACLEGLEHVQMEFHDDLIDCFREAMKPGGVLVVSSPENPSGRSGPSEHNEYHLGELTRTDFLALLHRHFAAESVELVTQQAHLAYGVDTTCFYGICHRSDE